MWSVDVTLVETWLLDLDDNSYEADDLFDAHLHTLRGK